MAELYHGGAPGFARGDLIEPHPTKHVDGCPICAAAADENHRPDQVFATPVRLYARYYASKWGRGWLYQVLPIGPMELSDADSIETYMAPALRVVRVMQRGITLTGAERRALYRIWRASDRSRGIGMDAAAQAADAELRRMIGIGPREKL